MTKGNRAAGKPAKRFTFEPGEDGYRSIEIIENATGTSSQSAVIRDAIDIYVLLVERAANGETLFVGPDRERANELLVPQLRRAKRIAEQKKS